MLKKVKTKFPEIVLGILLTVAVFGMGMLYDSSRHQPTDAQPKQEAHQVKAPDQPEPFTMIWLTHDGAVFFTFVLSFIAAAQAGLFLWQLRYMKVGIKDASIAAKAADLSARAAIAMRMPIIRARPTNLNNGRTLSQDGVTQIENCSVPYLTFSNHGKDRAFPIETHFGWTIAHTLPERAEYPVVVPFDTDLIFEPDPNITKRQFTGFTMSIKDGQWSLICSNKLPVWFYCCVVYEDFMEQRHTWGLCWRWQNVGFAMDWLEEDNPTYKYKT